MIAYLIGGPQDMVKMVLRGNLSTLSFPHTEPIPVEPPASMQPFDVQVQNIIYRKVYENHSYMGRPFSVYVYFEIR